MKQEKRVASLRQRMGGVNAMALLPDQARAPTRGGGTRCVRSVRGEGRDVSGQYEGRDETRPVSTVLRVGRAARQVFAQKALPGEAPLLSKNMDYRCTSITNVVCEINTHPTCSQCWTPPLPPNVNIHGHVQSECNRTVK